MKLISTGVADEQDCLYLAKLEHTLQKDPYNYNLLLSKALFLYYPFLNTDKAEDIFKLIEKIYPNKYESFFWHGTSVFMYDANYEKAIELLRYAIKINENNAESYIMLARTLDENGQKKELEELYKKALFIKPQWPSTWDGLICILMDQQRYQEVGQIIKLAFENIPLNDEQSEDFIQKRLNQFVTGLSHINHIKATWTNFLEQITNNIKK